MTVKTIKAWYFVHKWTSLICTAFMLLLCITGLPLIFHHEIEHLLGDHAEARDLPAGTPMAPLDQVVANGRLQFPEYVMRYFSWDPEEPELVYLTLSPNVSSTPEEIIF